MWQVGPWATAATLCEDLPRSLEQQGTTSVSTAPRGVRRRSGAPISTKHLLLIFLTIIVPDSQARGSPMQKRTLFSPVSGQVLLGGKPVPRLEVVQRYDWLSVDGGAARTTTDAEGRFTFPEVSVRKLRAPKDVLIVQEIEVSFREKKITLWSHTKQSTTLNAELGGEPLVLVADLERPSQEVKLPVGGDQIVVFSGVATVRHPYLERWERVRAEVTEAGATCALERFLTSPEGLAGLGAFFPTVGDKPVRVMGIAKVADVQPTEGALFVQEKGGGFAYAAREEPRFVGFQTRAQVVVKLDSGEEVPTTFFTRAMYLPLDEAGKPAYEARLGDQWEVDARSYVRKRTEAVLVPVRVAALVRARLQEAPDEGFLEAFGAKPGTEGPVVEAVEVGEMRVEGSKDGWATLWVRGEVQVRISEREARHRFEGHLSVQLASLADPEYRPAAEGGPAMFRVYRFMVTLKTDKAVYAPGEKTVLEFRVENLMDTPQQFLKWHTPFEGFANDFLEVQPVGVAERVAYHGVLVSRGPPRSESYLALGPREAATSTIEITQAYPVAAKGDYVIRYRALGGGIWPGEARFAIR
ncbi:MAG: hypothetical protein HY901_04290 [Deltaproteobacteria bacterium]|nr:hypothetical protein [Deltaproteobacteria bacterium]